MKKAMIKRAEKIREVLKKQSAKNKDWFTSERFIANQIGSDVRSVRNLLEVAEILRNVKKVGYLKASKTVYRWEEKE